jgi:hypothetical protein
MASGICGGDPICLGKGKIEFLQVERQKSNADQSAQNYVNTGRNVGPEIKRGEVF